MIAWLVLTDKIYTNFATAVSGSTGDIGKTGAISTTSTTSLIKLLELLLPLLRFLLSLPVLQDNPALLSWLL